MDYANQHPPVYNNRQNNYNNGPSGDINHLPNGSHDYTNQSQPPPNAGLKSYGENPSHPQGPPRNYQQPTTNNYHPNTNLRSGGPSQPSGYHHQPSYTPPSAGSNPSPNNSYNQLPRSLHSSANNSQRNSPLPNAPSNAPNHQSAFTPPPTLTNQPYANQYKHQPAGQNYGAQNAPPLPGQPYTGQNTSKPPPPGQYSNQQTGASSRNFGQPPLPGQPYAPPTSKASQNQPSKVGGPNYLGQSGPMNSAPPLPGQQYTSQSGAMNSAPPLPGQQYTSQSGTMNSAPPLPGQQYTSQSGAINSAPPLPGQQYTSQSGSMNSAPPLPGQQYTSQSGSMNSAPPLPGQQYTSQSGTMNSSPPLPGQQYTSQSGSMNSAPPLPGQQYTSQSGSMNSPPPLPGQQYTSQSGTINSPPPLPGQQYTSQSGPINPPPPLPGQFQNQPQGIQPTAGQGMGRQAAPNNLPNLNNQMGNMGISEANRPVNLMQESRILPRLKPVENPLQFETNADHGMLIPPKRRNCKPSLLRCTLKAVPQTQNLLNKVKLPFGLVIHPFKDLSSLPVISAGTIVRCKRCRTYINPFVSFLDARRWRCNMCFAVNDTPEEFLHHPVLKTYGEPHTRPECTNSTIEFNAPQEYMLRPPQPAVYLFLMDVSHSAIESGYLQIVCDTLLDNLDQLPGDARTRIGFLTYNGTVHFYRLSEGLSQPQMIVVSDIDDVFVPTPENLLVSLKEGKSLIQDLLHQLPLLHSSSSSVEEVDTFSALGSALEVAKTLMSPFGGRVTVFQQSIPSAGPGTLKSREDPNNRAREPPATSLNPATDFYKKLALDCSAHQVAVDFFFFNSQYVDIATLSCASRFSAGDLHYYPALHTQHNPAEVERLARDLERYLQRKIGFEAVMRIRCTKGLAVHTFHGNFFVRSTDLLALANVNPDSGFAVNLSIEDSLTDLTAVCFQAALLYTSTKNERRIRVHTMCVPVVKTPAEVLQNVDCVAVVSLLAKMGVDRAITASIPDARDALLNACIDPIKAFKETLPPGMATSGVFVPKCLRLFPLYIHSLLKHPAFRSGVSTKLDDRVFAMINFKMQPASYLMQDLHPDLYRVDNLDTVELTKLGDREIPLPYLLPLSSESVMQNGSFLLDCGWKFILLVGRQTNQTFINDVLDAPQFSSIEDPMYGVPELENPASELFHSLLDWLQDIRPHYAPLRVIRDDSRERILFFSKLLQDRTESSMSLQEFLIHIQQKLQK